ncbi:hypothetical protein, partial [Streptomyces syringium]|uniref:hypothetical protein n=1 Tax=Streptomyces syringium TaxID=76729 RepID=UPI0033B31CE1
VDEQDDAVGGGEVGGVAVHGLGVAQVLAGGVGRAVVVVSGTRRGPRRERADTSYRSLIN